jgi:tRNA-splicing ligase RtcB (3'-phosphate/5'-hydroxy nucleic acid ligase)
LYLNLKLKNDDIVAFKPISGVDLEFRKISEVKFELERDESKGMGSSVIIYSTEQMLEKIKTDRTISQAINTTTLPGLVGNVLLMPDAHEGYGFPVGGVAAFDSENGIISPGAVGYDINCGVRLIKTNLKEKEVRQNMGKLLDALFKNVPSGVGSRLKAGFTQTDLERMSEEGASYAVKKGFGWDKDIGRIEESGKLRADFSKVSKEAKSRGIDELGTLGAGNHFLEVQKVEKVLDEKIAKDYGLSEGQAVIMVHCGSRGFGHQICSDYLRTLVEYQAKENIHIVDKELSYAKIGSKEAEDYLSAMGCAVNFAFANRQIIMHNVRKSFEEVFGKSADEMGMELLYDVAHNIAKLEEHVVDGKKVKVYVHRKGATRAFARGREEVPKEYRGIGQPVIIPGSMGTASYILCGDEGSRETFGTTCHGSGRVMSRHQAIREISESRTFESLKSKGIDIRVRSRKLISEEAEWAYKNVDDVVGVVAKAGISKLVSRNVPMGVVKG